MQAAITFVEYPVSGATALLWLRLFAWPDAVSNLSTEKGAIVAVVFLYVLGMMVDYVSARVVGPLKSLIKKRLSTSPAEQFLKNGALPIYSTSAALMHLSKELATEHRAYSSRDRMARGAFLNLFMVAMVLPFSEKGFAIASKPLEVAVALVAATLMLAVWWQYERQSQSYKKEALATVLQLESREPTK